MAPVAESKKVIRISENMVLISEEEYEGLLRVIKGKRKCRISCEDR